VVASKAIVGGGGVLVSSSSAWKLAADLRAQTCSSSSNCSSQAHSTARRARRSASFRKLSFCCLRLGQKKKREARSQSSKTISDKSTFDGGRARLRLAQTRASKRASFFLSACNSLRSTWSDTLGEELGESVHPASSTVAMVMRVVVVVVVVMVVVVVVVVVVPMLPL